MLTTDSDSSTLPLDLEAPAAQETADASPVDELATIGPFAAMRKALLGNEVVRFLIVGVCNTLFSYLLYAAFGYLFTRLMPTMSQVWVAGLAYAAATPIGITFSFLNFKHFVFKTKGNYVKEWLRCFAVYGVGFPIGLGIIYVATALFLKTSMPHQYAKFAAGIVQSGIIAGYSYFANKKFAFKQ